MKIVIFKSYRRNSEVYFNYGDDVETVWHNFNSLHEVKEVTEEEFALLSRAISLFNRNSGNNFSYDIVAIAEEKELDFAIDSLLKYEAKLKKDVARKKADDEAKSLAKKANLDAKKKERAMKKLANELNISIDDVNNMLGNSKKN